MSPKLLHAVEHASLHTRHVIPWLADALYQCPQVMKDNHAEILMTGTLEVLIVFANANAVVDNRAQTTAIAARQRMVAMTD